MSGHYTNPCVGEIVTTDLAGSYGCNDGPTNDYTDTFSGTSAAAPQVSGIAALVLTSDFGLTAGEVKSRIRSTAVYWGRTDWYGSGKVDAAGAAPSQPPLSVTISGPAYIDAAGTYTWTATASGGNGSYAYQWQRSTNGSTWFNIGTNSRTFSEYEGSDGSFYLRVKVTSGGSTATSSSKHVTVNITCSPGDIC